MRIGVISDTHGHVRNTMNAIELFSSSRIEGIIHCGDIGSPSIPALFTAWPAHFVFGNVDQDESSLRSAIDAAGHTCHERFGHLEIESMRIAILHGDDHHRWQQTLAEGRYDVICCGHTHRPEARWEDRTLVLNPGAVYRARPHSIATLELPQRVVEFLQF